MGKHIAFFDLDHTILDINSGVILAKDAHRQKMIGKKDLLAGMLFSILFKAGLLGAEVIMERMAAWLRGTPENNFINFAEQVFRDRIEPSVRNQAREIIRKHKDNEDFTVLLSASTPYICNPVKEILELDDIICSKMEVIDGRFSGYPEGKYCYGNEKLVRTETYCREHGYELERAYYYADSYSDLPVLEVIGHPRCVTPDKKLTAIARSKGWPILQW